jgi:hypothetical protein
LQTWHENHDKQVK